MCFCCKLSFGHTKSFQLHASAEHALCATQAELQLLSREYSSAIIQRCADEKPQISFLEPLTGAQEVEEEPPRQQLVPRPLASLTGLVLVFLID